MKNNTGFTLIELLLVISAMSIVSVLSISFYSRFLLQNAVSNTQDQIVGQLRKAQIYAMMGKQNSGWGVNYASNTLTLFKGSTFATRTAAFDEIFMINPNVTITGLTEVDFARITGIPGTTASITISSNNNNSKTVTVSAQGMVSK